MTLLEISQIIFNLTISIAVIVVAVLISLIAVDILKFFKSTKKLSQEISRESAEIYEKINKFLKNIPMITFISRFFRKKNKIN